MLTRLKIKVLGWLKVTPKESVFEKVSADAFLASMKAPAKKTAKKAPAKKTAKKTAKKAPAKKTSAKKTK